MKSDIHPKYNTITLSCACGNSFQAGSTLSNDLRVEICAHCHPLYTGKSKLVDTAGRVDKFHARQEKARAAQETILIRESGKAKKEADASALAQELEEAAKKAKSK